MNFKDRTVLVVGLARSGLATGKVLKSLGARVLANDLKSELELKDAQQELSSIGVECFLGMPPDSLLEQADLVVISPAVPIDAPFVQKAISMGIEVISEIELAYRLCKAPIIAITGTNGKTTTTSLVGEIFKADHRLTHVVGNIGIPFIGIAAQASKSDIVVAEISSFQLEGVYNFHPKVAAVLNITEDHLNRHKTIENYINLKAKVFQNSTESDWIILNADDGNTSSFIPKIKGNILLFSRKHILERGAWMEQDWIVVDIGQGKQWVCRGKDVFIPGSHNLENTLAATLMAHVMGVPLATIANTLKTFRGVEHRIELVDTIDGITFYNDSKGTNPDSTIKAIEAMRAPTVLIAGGYDKESDFNVLIDSFESIISHLVVLGETSDKISKAAREKGFCKIFKVDTLEEGVKKAFSLVRPNGNVLLSPACASWDMFQDYEERGRVFKEAVKALKEERI